MLSCVRLVLVNYKILNIWDDEGSRRDIVGCVRLSFKLRLILVNHSVVKIVDICKFSVNYL